jgi:predicted amidophosphoribosyltransferase
VQVGASAEKRKKQAQEAYALRADFDPDLHYVLVDDVWTTGSSMLAAAQKLRSCGAQHVDILVIAKTV